MLLQKHEAFLIRTRIIYIVESAGFEQEPLLHTAYQRTKDLRET